VISACKKAGMRHFTLEIEGNRRGTLMLAGEWWGFEDCRNGGLRNEE